MQVLFPSGYINIETLPVECPFCRYEREYFVRTRQEIDMLVTFTDCCCFQEEHSVLERLRGIALKHLGKADIHSEDFRSHSAMRAEVEQDRQLKRTIIDKRSEFKLEARWNFVHKRFLELTEEVQRNQSAFSRLFCPQSEQSLMRIKQEFIPSSV